MFFSNNFAKSKSIYSKARYIGKVDVLTSFNDIKLMWLSDFRIDISRRRLEGIPSFSMFSNLSTFNATTLIAQNQTVLPMCSFRAFLLPHQHSFLLRTTHTLVAPGPSSSWKRLAVRYFAFEASHFILFPGTVQLFHHSVSRPKKTTDQ